MKTLAPSTPLSPQAVSALTLLGLLFAVDLLFIVMHAVHAWSPWLRGAQYSLDADRGMAELFQYVKLIWVCACLTLAFARTRHGVYLAWTALFGFLLLDDMGQFHERAGTLIANTFGFAPMFGLRAKDFGEILFAAAVGAIAVLFVIYTFKRGLPAAKRASADVLILLCALAFFGVFFDALHTIAFFKAPALVAALTLIEDGGEMLVVSILTVYAFDLASSLGDARDALLKRFTWLDRWRTGAADA